MQYVMRIREVTDARYRRRAHDETVPGGGRARRPRDNLIGGLVLNRFADGGINTTNGGTTGVPVAGCFIGTDASGTIDLGNRFGVEVGNDGAGAKIGGLGPAQRNWGSPPPARSGGNRLP